MFWYFCVIVFVPLGEACRSYSSLTAVGLVFGAPVVIAVSFTFMTFFALASVMYNVTFARILFVSALDHRLPTNIAEVNRHHAPAQAILVQTALAFAIALFTYFLGPLLYLGEGATFSAQVYNVFQA